MIISINFKGNKSNMGANLTMCCEVSQAQQPTFVEEPKVVKFQPHYHHRKKFNHDAPSEYMVES